MIIALGFILPGVSGGVLAAILGIYERMLSFLAHIRRNFKADFFYFLPVGIGGILGIGLLSRPLEFLLAHYQVIVLWGFAGAIVGSLPALWQEAESQSQRDKIDWSWLIGTFVASLVILYRMPYIFGTLPANFVTFILAGALIALGVLIPGLSPSNLLLILGLYSPMLIGFKNFDLLNVFLPITIGGILAVLLFAKSMEYLLEHHHSRVFHFILGIVSASTILILVPNNQSAESITYDGSNLLTLVLAVIFTVLGLWLGLWMSKLEERYK
ncbi:membrane protein [Lactococcus chungangensis CAU 28 = DSM 22330]|uniref:Membrane protein n=1 Tax=Pseudolactococcus chungangensis CAU 28 = DSM 22330 TaxID=1122154 RepID=A0ABX4I961_9LACT|nr:membrane protein [Lactococcus chungangensis CAU 28 = DSM 22330]